MTNPDKTRPALPEEILDGIVSSAEDFQNRVLRPVIKMQNDLLLAHLKAKLKAMKVEWGRLTPLQQRAILSGLFTKDQSFKHEIIGMVIGQFTISEYTAYLKNQKELNRRITQMTLERCSDNV
jgi:hypothetical protein